MYRERDYHAEEEAELRFEAMLIRREEYLMEEKINQTIYKQKQADMTNLYQLIFDAFNEGKSEHPHSIVAVDHENALYFLQSDAELISSLYKKKLEAVNGTPICIVAKTEHNELATVIYENKLLMSTVRTAPVVEAGPNWSAFMDTFINDIVNPYNQELIKKHKRD